MERKSKELSGERRKLNLTLLSSHHGAVKTHPVGKRKKLRDGKMSVLRDTQYPNHQKFPSNQQLESDLMIETVGR